MTKIFGGSDWGSNQNLEFIAVFRYKPIRCPVRWSESVSDIPKWDWTRGVSPDFTLFDVEGSKADDPYWSGFSHREPSTHQEFPRLVRSTVKHEEMPPVAVSLIAEFKRLESKIGTKEFKDSVLKAVPKIGLLEYPMGIGCPNALFEWEYAAIEIQFWDALQKFVLKKTDLSMYPLPIEFWDEFRLSLGLKRPDWGEPPREANFIGGKRDTLDGAGLNGEIVEVGLGSWLKLNPKHPETDRGIRAGSVRTLENLPWFNDCDPSPSRKESLIYLTDIALQATRFAKNRKDFQKQLEEYCLGQFLEATSGSLFLENDIFFASVGALQGAYLELAKRWGFEGSDVCHHCGEVFLKTKGKVGEKYCPAPKTCYDRAKSKRRYAKLTGKVLL